MMIGTPGGGIWTTNTNGQVWTNQLSNFHAAPDPNIYDLQLDRLNGSPLVFALSPSTLAATSNFGTTWSQVVITGATPRTVKSIGSAAIGIEQGADFAKPFTQLMRPSNSQHPNGERVLLWGAPCDGLYFTNSDAANGGQIGAQNHQVPNGAGNDLSCIQSIAADDTTGYIYISIIAVNNVLEPTVWQSTWNSTTGMPNQPWNQMTNGLPRQGSQLSLSLAWPYQSGVLVGIDHATSPARAYELNAGVWASYPGTISGTYNFPTNGQPVQQNVAFNLARTVALGSTKTKPNGELFIDESGGANVSGVNAYTQNLAFGPNPPAPFWNWFGSPSFIPSGNNPEESPDTVAIAPFDAMSLLYVGTGSEDAVGGASTTSHLGNVMYFHWNAGGQPGAPTSTAMGPPAVNTTFFKVLPAPNQHLGGGATNRRYLLGGEELDVIYCADLPPEIATDWTPLEATGPAGLSDVFGSDPSAFVSSSDGSVAYYYSFSQGFQVIKGIGQAVSCASPSITMSAGFTTFFNIPARSSNAMTIDPNNSSIVYVAEQFDIQQSQNGGTTFTKEPGPVSNGVPLAITSVYADPSGASGTIIVGTIGGGAYRSVNFGAAWLPFGLNAAPPVAVLTAAYTSPGIGTYYLGTTQGLYQQLAGGPWTEITGLTEYSFNRVVADQACPEHILAAIGQNTGREGSIARSQFFPNQNGGVLLSRDNAAHWTNLTIGAGSDFPAIDGAAPFIDVGWDPLATPASPSQFAYFGAYAAGSELEQFTGALACP